MADRTIAADVEDFAVARVDRARQQQRIGGVVHVREVAPLSAVAEELDLPVFDGLAYEPGDESLAVVADQLSRPVDVGEPQRARANAEDIVVDEMVLLAGRLVDAVHVGRTHQVRLVDRQRVGPAVDLARSGEDDFRAGLWWRHASSIVSWLRQLISRSM